MSASETAVAPPDLVILAEGADNKLTTDHPPELHSLLFRPMIDHVLDAALSYLPRTASLVVGPWEREFQEHCRSYSGLRIVRQAAPFGSANEAKAILSVLSEDASDVLLLRGTAVLVSPETLKNLREAHAASGSGCTVARTEGAEGEIPVCCFRVRELAEALRRIEASKGQKTSFLRDVVAASASLGARAAEFTLSDPSEATIVTDHRRLWTAETILRDRVNRELMLKGVSLQDPLTTYIDPRCRIERDVRIAGGCTLVNSVVESGAEVENFCRIVDSEIGRDSRVRQGTRIEASSLGRGAHAGPYARLRDGARLEDGVRVGDFVEIKNASLGAGTRVAHLSFIGDAQIGRNVNVGSGFITCNSSGKPLKQRTIIEDDVFIGSASQAIAPVAIGARSFIATGTSVTDNVPPDSFVISRGRQITKPGYAKKFLTPSGRAVPSSGSSL